MMSREKISIFDRFKAFGLYVFLLFVWVICLSLFSSFFQFLIHLFPALKDIPTIFVVLVLFIVPAIVSVLVFFALFYLSGVFEKNSFEKELSKLKTYPAANKMLLRFLKKSPDKARKIAEYVSKWSVPVGEKDISDLMSMASVTGFHFREFELDKRIYKKVLDFNPGNFEANWMLFILSIRANDVDTAESCASGLVDLDYSSVLKSYKSTPFHKSGLEDISKFSPAKEFSDLYFAVADFFKMIRDENKALKATRIANEILIS